MNDYHVMILDLLLKRLVRICPKFHFSENIFDEDFCPKFYPPKAFVLNVTRQTSSAETQAQYEVHNTDPIKE